ncbi:MAG: peptidylprolyl isomerase [Steroidobacteraceae bacterium]
MSDRISRKRLDLPRLAAAWARRPRRGVALPTAGMVLGMILAGAGMFRLTSPPLVTVPPGYAALVDGEGILMSDFIEETQVDTGAPFDQTTPAQRAKVLRGMINSELLVQRAMVLDLPETTTEVRTVMGDAVNAQATAPALAVEPTDAALYAFYREYRTHYRSYGSMQLRDLVLRVGGYLNMDQTFSQAEADAIEAVYQLRSGAPVEPVMERFGIEDSGRLDGGPQFDFAAKLHLGERLYRIASELGSGEISDPMTMPDGVHVIVMINRQPPAVEDFPDARPQVYSDYRQWLVQQAEGANLSILRSRARILVAKGLPE